jgi:uncharacterized repeat protein (TIGR03803 family)
MANKNRNTPYPKALRMLLTSAVALGLVCFAGLAAQAQTLETILSFNGQQDGAYSSAGLTHDAGGNLYGTTQAGGIFNFNGGTVFRINRVGQEAVLHSFCAETNCADGSTPYGGVILDSAGNLYGATSAGGTLGFGAVFKIDSTGNETVLYSFQGLASGDGASPAYGNLVRDAAGNLYGVTLNGGLTCSYSTAGCGIVYKIDPAGNETVLHTFTGGIDGALPPADLIAGSGGNFFGTTFRGGPAGCGVVYKIGPTGTFTVPYDFNCEFGWGPNAGLVRDSSGNLFGTTAFGGTWSRGTVFKLSRATGAATDLHDFLGGTGDGCAPGPGNLTLDAAGNIYGTTPDCGASGYGIIFKLDPAGNETILYNFAANANGGIPQTTLLIDGAGNLWGTSYFINGFGCCGTVFKLTP